MTGEGEATVSPVPREARPYQGQPAGLVTRTVAAVVDALVVAALLLVGYAGLTALRFVVNPRGFQFTETSPLLSLTMATVVAVVYLTAAWAITGRTYGCHVMGLRVVGRRGGRPHMLVALARALLYVAFPIGLVWCAGSGTHRSLQDVVLRTSVVYDWMPRAEESGRRS